MKLYAGQLLRAPIQWLQSTQRNCAHGNAILNTKLSESFLDHIAQLLVVHGHDVIPAMNECDPFLGVYFFQITGH